ncbi:glucosaminidase domain-containing protein [Paenibacillus vini]|uniref:glucosaminidase domain-containing protein n=1 Tax=Paenibacillus vini TaxID=1476024 RepID=UPI0025B6ACEA|nr:glucosaminidase domain-containing protein [Paenibacillus vini]MDN4067547.1 glucosaminidase domain-containing protein [Paenibacillus vini]
MAEGSGKFDQLKEMLRQQAMQKIKKEIGKKVGQVVSKAILANPIFWIVVGVIVAIFLFFYIIAAAISTSQGIANDVQIYEKILPPQIYVSDLEDHITSDFGPRTHPVTGALESFHSGIDIGIPVGTPVINSFDGVVRTVSYPKGTDPDATKNAGIYIVVEGSDPEIGMTGRYLHLRESFVTTGQFVKKGEVIGLSGNTGRSTGPHLHFEMIPGGEEAIDPKPYILLMSKVTDAAKNAANSVFKNVSWSKVKALAPELPFYESSKILYISNVYMETAPPVFSESGSVSYKRLYNGGATDISDPNVDTDESTEDNTPPPEQVVTVPTEVGSLNHPFLIKYAAAAQKEELRSGIPASVTLAQAALESGWGRNSICNNMFGIKANKGYSGPSCSSKTNEEVGGVNIEITAKFRSYSSPEASIVDHSKFLLENPRYRVALSKVNPYEFANELQRAGYATDSQYANKVKSIIRSENLTSLDLNRGIDPATGEPFNDVAYVGGGSIGSGGGTNTTDSITVTFGIRQYYGNPAAEQRTITDITGETRTVYVPIEDPMTGNWIINLANYQRVVDWNYRSDIVSPDIIMKDLPEAISVTVVSEDDDLYVSRVEYKKGKY